VHVNRGRKDTCIHAQKIAFSKFNLANARKHVATIVPKRAPCRQWVHVNSDRKDTCIHAQKTIAFSKFNWGNARKYVFYPLENLLLPAYLILELRCRQSVKWWHGGRKRELNYSSDYSEQEDTPAAWSGQNSIVFTCWVQMHILCEIKEVNVSI
jgi:hypothetical protein